MSQTQEILDQWLRDAHAMEKQAVQLLTAQGKRIEHYPALQQRLEQHLSETHEQLAKLESCMKRRNVSSSPLKDAAGKIGAMVQGIGAMLSGDEVIKGLLANYTFEHMEIASYRILVAAAEEDGDTETQQICEGICAEEEQMAQWLAEHMQQNTREYLKREGSSQATAKR